MRPIRERFKKFGGEFIPDVIEYLKKQIEKKPTMTISVGCDSVQRKRKTLYAVTIMLYDQDIRNGAHLIFYRDNTQKIRDNFERLQKEVDYVLEVANFLESELEPFYVRKDLSEFERKRYKYHLEKCNGLFTNVQHTDEEFVIKRLPLTEYEKVQTFKLVDIHVDFNPFEGGIDNRGNYINKSHTTYKSFVPWLRGMGFRVFAKPLSHASSSAADLLLQD